MLFGCLLGNCWATVGSLGQMDTISTVETYIIHHILYLLWAWLTQSNLYGSAFCPNKLTILALSTIHAF
jgi:hypothetical protein